jgi:hypothetical protein
VLLEAVVVVLSVVDVLVDTVVDVVGDRVLSVNVPGSVTSPGPGRSAT